MNESSTEGGVDLLELIQTYLSTDFDLEQQVKHVCDEKSLEKSSKRKKQPKSLLEAKALVNKHLIINFKAGGNVIKGSRSVFNRGQRPDLFRSRPKKYIKASIFACRRLHGLRSPWTTTNRANWL